MVAHLLTDSINNKLNFPKKKSLWIYQIHTFGTDFFNSCRVIYSLLFYLNKGEESNFTTEI